MDNIIKSTLILFVISIFAKISGFGRDLIIAYSFGATHIVDLFYFAELLPNAIVYFTQGGFITAFIPTFNKINNKEKLSEKMLVNKMISFILLSSSAMIFIILLLEKNFLSNVVDNYSENDISIIIKISYLLLPIVLLNGVFCIFRGIQESKKNFFPPAISIVITNILIILFVILLSERYSIYSIAIGMFVGNVLQLLFQMPFVRDYCKSFRIDFRFNTPGFYEVIRLSIPMIIGNLVTYMVMFNSRWLASSLDTGSIAYLNYSYKLYLAVMSSLIVPVVTVAYPHLIILINKGDECKFREKTRSYLKIICLIIFPISIFCSANSEYIIQLFYERGAFTHYDTMITGNIFSVFSICIAFSAIIEFINKCFYATSNTILPNKINIICLLVNIIIAFGFVKTLGIYSIPLGYIVSLMINSLILLYLYISNFMDVKIRKKELLTMLIIIFFLVSIVSLIKFTIKINTDTSTYIALYLFIEFIIYILVYLAVLQYTNLIDDKNMIKNIISTFKGKFWR